MANTNSSKGNPAGKRMGNANLKARRAGSWRDGEERKQLRRAVQDQAHKANEARHSTGMRTIWEEACERRARARKADPEVQKRARQYSGKVL